MVVDWENVFGCGLGWLLMMVLSDVCTDRLPVLDGTITVFACVLY